MIVLHCLLISIIAFLWTNVLTKPKHIFDWLRFRFELKYGNNRPKLKNVMLDCPMCFGGQLSLWTYILFSLVDLGRYDVIRYYDPVEHLIVVGLTIFCAFWVVYPGKIIVSIAKMLKED